jgi:hypothetical protein
MRCGDFIPETDGSFDVWQHILMKSLAARREDWGITTTEWTALTKLQTEFERKFAAANYNETRTPAAIIGKNVALAAYKKQLRVVIKAHITYNLAVTEPERKSMGLPVHKTKRTPAPVAESYPWIRANTGLLRHVRFDYGSFDPDTTEPSKAKPPGQHGVEFGWVIRETPIVNMDELSHSSFDTHTPLTLEFKDSDRGKTLWYAARWENTRGKKGPWGPIESVIIP